MKKNRILILSMLCVLALDSCKNAGSGGGEPIDTTAVVKDFLISRGVVEEEDFRIAEDEKKVTANQIVDALRGPDWKKRSGLVPIRDAYDQINTYIDLTFRPKLRSFTIERKVFEDYLKNSPDTLESFKFCMGVAKDGGVINKKERSLIVIGISKDGFLISLKDGGKECYYDQISPCPSDCPRDKMKGGRSHCDYLDTIPTILSGRDCLDN